MISRKLHTTRTPQTPAVSNGAGQWTLILLFAAILLLRSPLRAAYPQSDIDSQYQSVLAQMKHPSAAGLLVTEIGPDSPAGNAGLHAGDIIYHYAGENLHDLQTLRQKVADILAANALNPSDEKVLLGIHRQDKDLILQLPRSPLGIRAIEVDAGVPVTPNPLPSPRGSFTMAWDDLIKNQIAPDNAPAFFRTTTTDPTSHEETQINWQTRTLTVGDNALLGQVSLFRPDPNTPSSARAETLQFRLRTGDNIQDYPFLLDTLSATLIEDNTTITLSAHRAGINLLHHSQNQNDLATPCPINALPNAALPTLAAAMPQQPNAALSLSILSIRDFLSRPGYLLITRGKQNLPSTTNPAWRIDLLHCGVIVESYYTTNQRRLLQIDTPGTTPESTHRVATETEASQPMTPKSTSQPATIPK